MFYGEILSIIVAIIWTATALCAEIASKRIGSLQMNVLRMAASLVIIALVLWAFTGSPFPLNMKAEALVWLLCSGFVGYVFGDWCLFSSYIIMGSRLGQLFMTLAPLFSALSAWIILGETLTFQAIVGILITISGIAMVVHKKSDSERTIPLRGIFYGIGAGMGQGIGIVLSKVGMSMCPDTPMLPMSATMVRAISGLIGFGLVYYIKGDRARMRQGLHDRKTMAAATGTILLGPVIGVSLSLLAVQMTPAGIASTLMALTPVFILWPSQWIFGQRITLREVLGSTIAVAGVALFFV